MKTPHTSCRTGKRILIKLKNGIKFVAKYKETKGNYILFLDHDKVVRGEVSGFSFYNANLKY